MVKGYNIWGYPIYMTDKEEAWKAIADDWHYHDWSILGHDLYMQDLCERWLHGDGNVADYSGIPCPHAQFCLMELEGTPFTPKASCDIRRNKTRDYRRRTPKAPRYNPEIVTPVIIMACLLGVYS